MPQKFSASVAARHMHCHASANLPAAIPGWVEPVRDPDKPSAANHGTMVHEILAKAMELPLSELRALMRAIEYVESIKSQRRFKSLIEAPLMADWLDDPVPTTVDLGLYTQDEIHVIDWKWGKIRVSVYDNIQLLYYAASLIHLAPKAKGVNLHIVQPRIDNMETVFVPTLELKKFMLEARAAQNAINKGSLKFGPSDHCTFCPANPHGRGDKGRPLCPVMLNILYPPLIDESEILNG